MTRAHPTPAGLALEKTPIVSSLQTISSDPISPYTAASSWDYIGRPKVLGGPSDQFERSPMRSWMTCHISSNNVRSNYRTAVLLRLPFWFSGFAIEAQAVICFSAFHWPSICHNLSVKSIVPCQSDFMKHCSSGDLEMVRFLVHTRQGYPTDVDDMGTPALHVCIPLLLDRRCGHSQANRELSRVHPMGL